MVLKKIHHLIRYFFILGIISFVGYIKNLHQDIFLALNGPCLYIAQSIFDMIGEKIRNLGASQDIKFYGFLLPVTLVYFTFIGFQLKQLWNERGIAKWIILFIFIVFILYAHFTAYSKISGFLVSDF